MSFDLALQLVLKWEGAYDDDPDDPGGETCFGITRKYQAFWKGWPRVEELRREGVPPSQWHLDGVLMGEVREYYRILWAGLSLDDVADADLQATIFGSAVNQGKERTVRWLQEALVDLGHHLTIDSTMGPATIGAVRRSLALGQCKGLRSTLQAKRAQAYTVTASKRPGMAKFLAGWMNRLFGGA